MSKPLETSLDFDFLMGIWKVRHRYLARRLASCGEWLEFDGSCAAREVLDGCGNTDEYDIGLPGCPYKGMTLRLYDPEIGKWSIYWADSRHPGHLTPPVVGDFEEGVGTFYGDDQLDGRAIRVRFLWSRIARQSAHWEQAFSLDHGTSWETNWYMDFTRV